MKRYVEVRNLRSKNEIERILKKYVLPTWADRPISLLKRADVTALLDKIEDGSGPRQADMVLAVVGKIFRWHQARTDEFIPPLAPGMRRCIPSERNRKRVLSDDEIRALWAAASKVPTFGALCQMLLLTAQRKGKVRAMQFGDIDNDVWTIRTERREKGNAGVIKLSKLALDIIAGQPRLGGNPHVFAAQTGEGAFNRFSDAKKKLDAEIRNSISTLPNWTVHDLRRTARSLMSRAGVRQDVAERTLGHVQPGVIEVYDRHTYNEEKADALARVAGIIDTIVKPKPHNVIQISPARNTGATNSL